MPFHNGCCTAGTPIPWWVNHVHSRQILKILIVDDETLLAETLARFLAQLGHDCLSAPDVRQAIDLITQHYPHRVVTDLRLPDGDGFDVIRHVRTALPETRAILMTSYHSPGMERAAQQAGAAAYLRKPFALADFRNAVERA